MATRANTRHSGAVDLSSLLSLMTDPNGFASDLLPLAIQRATFESANGFSCGPLSRSIVIPLEYLLQRDLEVATATAAGNLVGTQKQTLVGSLRGFSVAASAGATVLPVPAGELPAIPVVSTPPVAGFVANEGGAVPGSDHVIGLKSVNPKTVGVTTNLSRKLILQATPAARELLHAELLRAVGRAIDRAALQGAGGAEPLGLNGLAGVFVQAGAALAWAGVQSMQEAVANAGAFDSQCKWISTGTVRKVLAQREKASGSGFIWSDDLIGGRAASVTPDCPAGSLFYGEWAQMFIVIHGGIALSVSEIPNPAGQHRVIVLADVDVTVPQAGAFARATSIT